MPFFVSPTWPSVFSCNRVATPLPLLRLLGGVQPQSPLPQCWEVAAVAAVLHLGALQLVAGARQQE
jgi:hypothetical protein